jgi:hypothetical protein
MPDARYADAETCPVRPGDSCKLCVPGASGPHNCGLVYLVMSDPDLRSRLLSMTSDRQLSR